MFHITVWLTACFTHFALAFHEQLTGIGINALCKQTIVYCSDNFRVGTENKAKEMRDVSLISNKSSNRRQCIVPPWNIFLKKFPANTRSG